MTTIADVALPIEERWGIKRCRYATEGASAGRVCIATGTHGDEMMGQLIVYRIEQRIAANPNALNGVVDFYPMLNPLGLDIAHRMVPSATRLDMNRAFPGSPDGTPLEYLCWQIIQDMSGADLVLDIHASARNKSELYEVRVSAKDADRLIPRVRALRPQLIWVYPDKGSFSASLTGALCDAGTDAVILEADERRRMPQEIAEMVIEGIFCKLREMGIWTGEAQNAPTQSEAIPTVLSQEDVCRVACEYPGVYVPEDFLGTHVQAGQVLGTVIDALEGVAREEIKAPCSGLVFSQRSYSAVSPGTLIARYYGADDTAGIHRTYGLMTVGTQAASALFMLIALLSPEAVVRLFSSDAETITLGASYLRIIAISYPFLALTRGGGTLLQSTGRVMIPFVGSLISVAVNIVLNALLIFGLCGFPALGVQGAAIASLISAIVNALVVYGAGLAKKTLLRTGLSALRGITGSFIRDFAVVSTPAMLNETMWALGNLMYSSVYGHMGTGAYASITGVRTIEELMSVAVMGLCSS